jgi:4-amino-4-deoxy-L-arabinose transferase-like glycosyltransferase
MTAAPVGAGAPTLRLARRRWLALLAALGLSLCLRGGLLLAGVVPFNADEAVVGLMARHILQGERPIFFYGQAYLGSLDTWLVAGAFALVGESVWAIRLVQLVVFLGTLATSYWLALRIYRSEWIAGAAAVFLAIPPVLVTLYTTVSLGGYGEALLLGNLILLLALALLNQPPPSPAWRVFGWLLLGILAGLGFWTFPLTLVYVVPVAVAAVVVHWRRWVSLAAGLLVAAAGFALGAAPWIWYTVTHDPATVNETFGSAIAGASAGHPVFAIFEHLFNFLLFGPTVIWGMRPPWGADFLGLPLVPFALAVHIGATGFMLRRLSHRRDPARLGRTLLAGVCFTVVTAFIFSPFGADPSGRYFLPLAVPVALFTAELFHWLRLRRRQRRSPWRKWFGQVLALGVVAFYWWGNVQSAAAFPPGLNTQFDPNVRVDQRALDDLMAFLRAEGETRGYTNYWVSYPLAFLSQEEIIFEARLPYHADLRYTPRDSRYPPYAALVAGSDRVAYITTRSSLLDAHLRRVFADLEVQYRHRTFGDYQVFYALSRRVDAALVDASDDCCRP